jgi:Zn-finger protein
MERMLMSYRFFQNRDCEYFPCHEVTQKQKETFNCIFCYCPLYHRMDCGGCYELMKNGRKDCTACIQPHYNYDYIVRKLMEDFTEADRNTSKDQ